jgi:hypothetical protein
MCSCFSPGTVLFDGADSCLQIPGFMTLLADFYRTGNNRLFDKDPKEATKWYQLVCDSETFSPEVRGLAACFFFFIIVVIYICVEVFMFMTGDHESRFFRVSN